jgi:uncharacterized SAM-binding protein YcdF (DUF218 family)
MKKSTIWILGIVMGLSFLSLLYLQVSYIEEMMKTRKEQFDSAVRNSLDQVSKDVEYAETRRWLIEDISEADAMEQYLIEQGVAENRIRKEDQSVSTRENLSFSRRFIDPKHETVGIVTNNFHSYRAKLLAEQEGYAHVFSVSASSNYVFQINYLVREFFAVLAIFLKNKRIL